jgi:hypothetical protein
METTKTIHYGNATDKQREYIRGMIHNRLGSCQSALVDMLLQRGDVDGFTWEDVEGVYPDPSDWSLDRCREYLGDNGIGTPDPDPWNIDREECIELLTSIDIECRDDDTLETLREAVAANIDDGTLDGLEDWRDAVRDNAEAQEVYEWWPVEDSYLAEQLKDYGEPILDNDYGTWWGRTCTGQSIKLDPTFWEIFQDALQKGYAG